MSSSFIYLADFPEKLSLMNSSGAITYIRRPLRYLAEFANSRGFVKLWWFLVRPSGWRKSLVSKDPNESQSNYINQTSTIDIIKMLEVATTALTVALVNSKSEKLDGEAVCAWCNAWFVKHDAIKLFYNSMQFFCQYRKQSLRPDDCIIHTYCASAPAHLSIICVCL